MKIKKILAAVLALCMALSMVSVTSFANEEVNDAILVPENISTEAETEVIEETEEEVDVVEEAAEEVEESEEAELFAEETEEENSTVVATVGSKEFTVFNEAVDEWVKTAGSVLTLKSNVTITETIKLDSNKVHTLNLGTYTLTADGCNAIQIVNQNLKSPTFALYINADAENPGGIKAEGKSCIYYTRLSGSMGSKDRPIIVINNGIFTGKKCIEQAGSNGTNSPQYRIYGGVFNATSYCIQTNRAMVWIAGGEFNNINYFSVDSSSYLMIYGGRFVDVSNWVRSDLDEGIRKTIANGKTSEADIRSAHKWNFGTTKGVYDADIYVDEEGYYVVTPTIPASRDGFEVSVTKNVTDKYTDSFYYSNIRAEGALYYKSAEVAFKEYDAVNIVNSVDADKEIADGKTFTLDLTNANADYTGTVTFAGEKSTFNAIFNADEYKEISFAKPEGYNVVKTSEENTDGTVTYTYKIEVAKSVEEEVEVVNGEFEQTVTVYTKDEDNNIKSFEVTVSSDNAEFVKDETDASSDVKMAVEYLGADEDMETENNYIDTHKFDVTFINDEGNAVTFKGKAKVVIKYETDKPENYMVFYKAEDGTLEKMDAAYDEALGAFVFETSHFSDYVIADVQSAYAQGITASLKKINEREYQVVLTGDNDTIINKFRSAQLQIDFKNLTGGLSHIVKEGDNIQIIRPENSKSDIYEFNVVGTDDDTESVNYITEKEIVLATIELHNHGTGTISIVQNAKSMVYTTAVETEAVEKIIIPTAADVKDIDIKPIEEKLTIKVMFDKNTITDNANAYQQLYVRIYGGDLKEDIKYYLGNATDEVALSGNVYTIETSLRKGLIYNVEVSGKGYRTYDHQVIMTGEKELTFWNNLKGGANDPKIKIDKDAADTDVYAWTLLEGDVVMDYTVDIYDLSAVVSYFNRGFDKTKAEDAHYAAYDLNRDGKIDAVDIGRVLNSWGK